MDIKKAKKIYIIGIEGAGTSALAVLLQKMGKEISGSDEGDHFYFSNLKKAGIKVWHKFDAKNLPSDVDLIIYSTAYNKDNNTELSVAIKKRMKILKYAEALAYVFKEKFGIAVCGSHGKTTTSAWLTYVLQKSGYYPSAIIGSNVSQLHGGGLAGKGNYFVIEADEYQNKLSYYYPKAVVLNNIDYDHPDFFPSKEAYLETFIDFIKKIPKKGFLVANFDHPLVKKVAGVNCRGRVISYAIDGTADYLAYDLRSIGNKQYFRIKLRNNFFDDSSENLGDFAISLPGKHNIQNALAVIVTCIELEVPLDLIREHLENFRGVARRLEEMGKYKGALIIDDYAHHPVEIVASIEGLCQKYKKVDYLVFHPHTFTRTKALLDDFASAFGRVDVLIVLDIYGSAREKTGVVHTKDMIAKIESLPKQNRPRKVIYLPHPGDAKKYLTKNLKSGDLLVLMGAGDVHFIGREMIKGS